MASNYDPGEGIYSVLLGAAVVALAVSVGVLWWANTDLTDQGDGFANPFHIAEIDR